MVIFVDGNSVVVLVWVVGELLVIILWIVVKFRLVKVGLNNLGLGKWLVIIGRWEW